MSGPLDTLDGWAAAREALLRQVDDPDDPQLPPELDRIGRLVPTAADGTAAWQLYVELSTRISVAALRRREGDEAAALDSLYKLFLRQRELVTQNGQGAPVFVALVSLVFETRVRPFTGYWHGRKSKGVLTQPDERRNFRRQLRTLSASLTALADVLYLLVGQARIVLPRRDRSVRLDRAQLWPTSFIGPVGSNSCPPSIAEELERIRDRRQRAYDLADEQQLGGLGPAATADETRSALGFVGLALSGGGIRSATFCLGVLQCLQRHGILRDVDYLSTVSGGGYLGAFLSTRLWAGAKKAAGRSSSAPPLPYDKVLDQLLVQADGRTGDSRAVRWLRNNSKYLLSRNWKERRQTVMQYAKGLLPWGPSLHSFYRDRLSRAYINDGSSDGQPAPCLSELAATASGAPFHLVNAAVNLPASADIELRGRRSDFFLLSPLWTGSVVTGYCRTEDLEAALKKRGENCDLSTAMAISGAAVSPHMGTRNLGAVARTALVAANVRLSHWLPNPSKVAAGKPPGRFSVMGSRWREARGTFDEDDDFVNLSDGGHVENLGVYELLRRRCKLIIAVDGECDPLRGSGALIKATRLAAIDLGVRIELDLAEVRLDESVSEPGLSQGHWAFGTIDYGPSASGAGRELGYIVYVKSLLTGNEPDYVKQYQRRHPAFPHQTTADQFFDEEQFEAYRALGEHAAGDLFGEDLVTAAELRAEPFRARRWLESLVRELT
jgi:hypothetical protein